jgi:hypothetical protein
MKAKVIVSDSFKTTITLYNHLNYSILYEKVTLLRKSEGAYAGRLYHV